MSTSPNNSNFVSSTAFLILSGFYIVGFSQLLFSACKDAFIIRLKAIEEYGRVIHEFDPYFNYRAAEYLWQHGSRKFFHWFDYQSWYPLGRPVGTTIYPGMQFTSMWIKMFILPDWSINDICCFVPAWFGVLATLATAAVCYVAVDSVKSSEKKSILQYIPIVSFLTEKLLIPVGQFVERQLKNMTGSNWGLATFKNPPAFESAVFTACIMSIVPAHLMRSIGGGYDNESVATTAMQLTFWFWVWTLATPSHPIILGTITGFAYLYMVAAWGGYVFVINLIGVHALILFLLQKMPWDHLYKSYTSFYVVGTLLAMQVPVVGWTPIKSLEQLGPLGVFLGFQGLQLMRILEQKYKNVYKWKVRVSVIVGGIIAAMPVVYYLYSIGYFGPISSRVRGLFVKHTKTGNPLVDSVAEHQAASPQAYEQYLDVAVDIAPIGLGLIALIGCTPASSFLIVYGVAAYFFSHKMVRLILLTAPIASICGGIALGYSWAWAMSAIFGDFRPSLDLLLGEEEDEETASTEVQKVQEEKPKDKKKQKKGKSKKENIVSSEEYDESKSKSKANLESYNGDPLWTRLVRLLIAAWFIMEAMPAVDSFRDKAEQMSQAFSHPTIIMKHGDYVIDDYRQAYFWLRDNTPEDARIMAWWDYGYQITGIANRTTIADGNTWNHEHIALLGRILTSPLKDAHRITRHLADYVLLWAGGGGDDVAKSPHLRRIANSVYRGLCREPTCRDFGFYQQGEPTPSMEASLLYNLHSHKIAPGVEADRNRFKEVYMSKNGKVRIFKVMSVSKESKEWVKNNRKCDAPGSWYCPGQYPPALEKILQEKKDFAQLEDFNRGAEDSEYQKQYFENLNKKGGGEGIEKKKMKKPSFEKLDQETIKVLNDHWEDSEQSSLMWQLISSGSGREFIEVLQDYPELAHIRSADGRGPMWWAHEYKRPKMAEVLTKLGVSDQLKDAEGRRPGE